MGRDRERDGSMGQAGTVVFHYGKPAGCEEKTLSIRRMQAVLAQPSRWLVGEIGRVHDHSSFELAFATLFQGPNGQPSLCTFYP